MAKNSVSINFDADAQDAVLAIDSLEREFIELAEAVRKVSDGEPLPKDFGDRFKKATKAIGTADSQLKKFTVNAKRMGKEVPPAVGRTEKRLRDLSKAMRTVNVATEKAGTKVTGITAAFQRMGSVINAVVASIAVRAFVRWTSAAVDLSRRMEKLVLQFNAFSDSAAEASKDLQFVKDTANKLGVDFQSLTQGFLRLKAAAKGTSVEGQTLQHVFSAVATTVRAVGSETDEIKGIFFAFEQLLSKNIVSAEELRRQLGDRIPGAFKRMADAIGVTTSELDGMLERGELLAEVALPLFAAELEKTFSGAALAQAQTIDAEMNRMQNTVAELASEFSEGLTPAVIDAMRTIRVEVGGALRDQAQETGLFIGYLSQFGATSAALFANLGDNIVATFARGGKASAAFGGSINALLGTIGVFGSETREEVERTTNVATSFWQRMVDKWSGDTKKSTNEIDKELEKIQKRIDELSEAGVKNMAELDGATNELALAVSAFGKIAARVAKSDLETFKKGGQGFEVFKKQMIGVILRAEELGEKVGPELQAKIDALGKQFEITAEDVAKAEIAFDKLGVKATKDIRELSNEIRLYMNRMGEMGDVTQEQADFIVRSSQTAIKQISALPPAQQETFAKSLAALRGNIEKFESLTTKSVQKSKQEFEKMASDAEKAAEKMGDAFEKAFASLGKSIDKETDKAQKKLKELEDAAKALSDGLEPEEIDIEGAEKLTRELEKLREKATLTAKDLERIAEIEDQLSDFEFGLASELKKARKEAEGLVASGDKVNDMITGLLTSNDALRDGYKLLNKEEKDALEATIADFQSLGQTVGVGKKDIEEFANQVGEILGRLGVDPVDLIGDLGITQDGVLNVAMAFDNLDRSIGNFEEKKRREKKLLDENAKSLLENKEGAEGFKDALSDLGDEAGGVDPSTPVNGADPVGGAGGDAGDAAREQARGVEELGDALGALEPTYNDYYQSEEEAARAQMDHANAILVTNEGMLHYSEANEQATQGVGEFSEQVSVLDDNIGEATDDIVRAGEANKELRDSMEDAALQVSNFGGNIVDVAGELGELEGDMSNMDAAALVAEESMSDLNVAFAENIDYAKLMEQWQKKTEKSVKDVGTETGKTTEELDELSKSLGEEFPEAAESAKESLDQIPEKLGELAEASKEAMGDVVGPLKEFNEQLTETHRLITGIGDAIKIIKTDGNEAGTLLVQIFKRLDEIL